MERVAMTRNGSIWMLTAVLVLAGLATPARAQVSEAPSSAQRPNWTASFPSLKQFNRISGRILT